MKYLTAFFAALLAMQVQAVPIINLQPSSGIVGINEVFTVDVFASGIEASDPLLAFGFDVQAGPGLSYNGATVAPPFLDDSAVFATTAVAGSTLPAVSGDNILLSTLFFGAGATPGLWDVLVVSSAGDLGLSEGLFTREENWEIGESVTVEVRGDAEVPLPSTLVLLCLGLLGLGARARS